ncbi:MAG TPA: hypothetical protein VKS21_11280, partial [Spirochaetota bacterium]|nr:hypothetical protein [Spirochaetota bacterium]
NYKADDLIKKVSAKVADINRVLSTILRSSVLDFSSPDVMRKIKKLSGYRREKELNNLKKIKQLQQAQYDLYQVLGRMNNKREGALQKSELIITGRIYPVVYIYYQNKHYKILKETNNKKFRYNQNKEEIESLDYIV